MELEVSTAGPEPITVKGPALTRVRPLVLRLMAMIAGRTNATHCGQERYTRTLKEGFSGASGLFNLHSLDFG